MGLITILKKNASGYIAFLDADDAWLDDFWDESIQEVLEHDFDIIGYQSAYCDEALLKRAAPIGLREGVFYGGGNDSVFLHDDNHFGAMLYSVAFLKQYSIRFDSTKKWSEDKFFAIECLYLAEKVYLQNKLMYLYRKNLLSVMHTTSTGIEYYEPIVDGYLKLDKRMEKYETKQRGRLLIGHKAASWYIADMMDSHFRAFRGKKEFDVFINQNSVFQELLEGDCGGIVPNDRWNQYRKQPYMYIFKQYLIGTVISIARCLLNIETIRKLRDSHRFIYPI